MSTLIVAYVIVWVGVAGYVARFSAAQRRLAERVQALETHLAEMDRSGSSIAAAA